MVISALPTLEAKVMVKKYIQEKLKKSEFMRHILILMLGTGLAQAIPILVSPIISRVYSPAEYSIFALYTSIVSIGATIVTLRYEQLIVLVKNKKEALNMTLLAFSIVIILLSIFIIFSLIIGKTYLLSLIHAEEMAPYFYLIFIGIFLTALAQILNYVFSCEKKYKNLAGIKIIQMGSLTTTQVCLGINGFGGLGLIAGNVIGNFVANAVLLRSFFKNIFNKSNISLKKIKELTRNYKKFPLYNTVSDTINVLASNLHIVLFLKYFGQEIVGIIAFTSLLFLAPISLISNSFSQVFYQKISTIESKEHLLKVYNGGLKYLLQIAAIVIAVSFLLPNNLIPFVFGEKWAGTSAYLLPLAVWFGFQFVGSSLSMIYVRLHKLGFLLTLNIINALSTYFIIYGGNIFSWAIYKTVLVFCLVKAMLYGCTAVLGIYVIKSSNGKL